MSANGTEKTGHHHVQRAGVWRVIFLQVLRHETDPVAQLPQVQGLAAEQLQIAAVLSDGVEFPVDQFQ
ncbi:hypothetical protein D3C87_1508730 [compost metagenome]